MCSPSYVGDGTIYTQVQNDHSDHYNFMNFTYSQQVQFGQSSLPTSYHMG